MSALFLITGLLTADPQPEKIESIVYLGTPEYAAKVRSLKLDYHDARYAAFLQGIEGYYQLHFAIINDSYFFKDRHEEKRFGGVFVDGNSGKVELLVFKDEQSSIIQNATAAHLKHGDCYLYCDAFEEDAYVPPSFLHAVIGFAVYLWDFGHESLAVTLKEASVRSLGTIIRESFGEVRREAAKELDDRGAVALPVILEFLTSDDRNLRLIGLGRLAAINADIKSADPIVMQIIRQTAAEDFPISALDFERILNKRVETLGPLLLATVNDPKLAAKERSYALDVLARVEDRRFLPQILDIAMRPDTEPIVARMAVARIFDEDKLVVLLSCKNKTSRLWACYRLASYSGYEQFPDKILTDMAQEPDADIRAAAAAAHKLIAKRVEAKAR